MKYFLILLLTGFLISCNADKKQSEAEVLSLDSIAVSVKTKSFPELSPKAREAVFEWKNFQELENNINYLNQGNLRNVSGETARMVAVSDTLLLYIPGNLQTNAISSRMRVLKTRISLLDELINRRGVSAEAVRENLEEMNNAFYNLLAQINEKFEKEEIDAITRTQENIQKSQNTQINDSI